ncbi:hypothetical protein [Candidatus Protochlamydia phocaeensis]|uniref:hypothetical protein n=1 Tax=Candidatus Protochlamydia phocaeensis TaxID=1414722 RepID=UPI000838DA03|nr:hypothetical protein [Candidatus Protochlamydia phocaeensis]
MKKQIVHLSVHQTSKVLAVMYAAVFTVFFVIPWAVSHLFQGELLAGLIVLVLMPFIYWIVLYIGYVVGCWVYNLIAARVGGIEFELQDITEQKEEKIKNEEKEEAVSPISSNHL